MKSRYIIFFHGYDKQLADKIASFCDLIESDAANDAFMYSGSLDDFERLYGGNFIVRNDPHVSYICVTQHKSFGQR